MVEGRLVEVTLPTPQGEEAPRYRIELGSWAAATWDKQVAIDPLEMAKNRRKQKVYLARYARQDVHAWEQRDVTELSAYYETLAEFMRQESALSRAGEDQ